MRAFLLYFSILLFQDPQTPTHQQGVVERGDHVMGFSHEKTTHHFLLYSNGGEINVATNDASDKGSLEQIRMHLGHIVKMFSAGNFNAPMLIHDQVPPGVPVMKEKKAAIRYTFEETKTGGRVVISTADPKAVSAIHDFLHFQISDHQTGDSGEVKPKQTHGR